MSFIEQYLLQLNTQKRWWRCAVVILTALSLVVALVTVWNLRMTGVTIANGATCGHEEHQHSDECKAETSLICEYSIEKTAAVEAEQPSEPMGETEAEHIHTDACYKTVYSCGSKRNLSEIKRACENRLF